MLPGGMPARRVAVTGIGVISPLGANLDPKGEYRPLAEEL